MASSQTIIEIAHRKAGPGVAGIAVANGVIIHVALCQHGTEVEQYFAKKYGALAQLASSSELDALCALASGKTQTCNIPYRAVGTEFQQRVWQGLCAIPAGQTRSYRQLAESIGKPRATRAVGSACGANPVAVIIPCHRVTRADGTLGGFYWGAEWKQYLLAQEQGR